MMQWRYDENRADFRPALPGEIEADPDALYIIQRGDVLMVREDGHERPMPERLEVAWTTAFRWRHRFLQLPSQRQASALRGIAEADESYFLESSKGQRALLRQARRRGGKASQRGVSKEQVSVLMVRDRAGATANILVARKRC